MDLLLYTALLPILLFSDALAFLRTRRSWKPNVQKKALYSEVLDKLVGPFYFTAYSIKLVDRHGGIDNYLLGTPDAKLLSPVAVALKREIHDALQKTPSASTSVLPVRPIY